MKNLIGNINDKSNMIRLSRDKDKRHRIEKETAWLNDILGDDIPLKIRCLVILEDINVNTFPKCKHCGNYTSFDKAYNNKLNTFCSDRCNRASGFGRLSEEAKVKLNDYDWLYQKRITEQTSLKNIGEMLGCSEVPVIEACKKLNIPNINLTKSSPQVQVFLNDREFLFNEHVVNHKQLHVIANEIGSSPSTISVAMQKHGIKTNPSNSYDRNGSRTSAECLEVYEYILSLIPETEVCLENRTILNGREIDIFIPSLNIGFEYNGIFSHLHIFNGNINKDKNYHLQKTVDSAKKGVKLYHIFSDDWVLNKDVVKGFIAAKLGIFAKTINGRDCEVIVPKRFERITFLDKYHLQGSDKSSIHYALKKETEIVAVMTFCKSRYNKNITWELSRFCVKGGYKVHGAFSKLLSHFRKNHEGSIVSYADRSYSFGEVYQKNGFTLTKTNPPGYKYVNLRKSLKRLHRANFMKKSIAPEDPRPEHEIMLERGYYQIYDCGQFTYTLN